ncbi:prolyl oligopeptidase family serine peptidase [Luteimonas sp. S4-F44]|uniref:carboxylesterase family protein n=1 Tax=Luteimonas sp. S4-F44 TaxID=2925842 RepID=UPI001F53B7C7|nr:prolyl oligopeptidase family serine peptidase [Luteimonas sp. S4-F44]UNK43278.1 prolyl oligopeptidase family serine peptidase [Luteimonas sp. S4-F44]
MSQSPDSTSRRRVLRGLALAGAGGAAWLAGCRSSPSTPASGRFVRRAVEVGGRHYAYQVFVPAAAVPRPLPVVLFLHGSGERGSDGDRQTRSGLGPYVRTHAADFPALVVFPQSPEGTSWEGDVASMALAALDAATTEFDGDPRRTSLTGMSRGGYGTWSLALRAPERFAALVPVCGGITPPGTRPDLNSLQVESTRDAPDPFDAAAQRLRDIPSWLFHGARDDVVPPEQSRRMYAALQRVGADVRYTEFPEANHNSWDAAYATPALWDWLFAQRR